MSLTLGLGIGVEPDPSHCSCLPAAHVFHGIALLETLTRFQLQKTLIKRQSDKGCENWLISVDLNHRH